ncbi:hypothetical protein VNO80_02572 [Phaseolus coccineus]|uniref:Uncharacterized protein n=1 Tax=Phaseolus coccineus TaxID=3886 RepID=A0AAN9NUE7_PHACN
MNDKAPSCADADGHVFPNQNLRQQHGQQQLRRQARRRLTNRPYQEKLVNMAEARKEIVTALKYHRATMKLANEHQQLQQHQPLLFQPSFYSRFSSDGRFKARRRPRMFLPPSNKISHYLNDLSFSSPFPPLPSLHFPPPSLPLPPPPLPNFYPNTIPSPFSHPLPKTKTPNFILPSQALGFNLNLHSFNSLESPLLLNNNTLDPNLLLNNNTLDPTLLLNNNTLDPTLLLDNNMLDPTHVLNNNISDPTPVLNNNNILKPALFPYNNNSSLCSYSSPTLTSPPFVTDQDVPSIGISQSLGEGVSIVMNTVESSTTTQANGSMHVAMDEEGMKEIRALGEQHQMEWDDNMSLVTSIWWFDCLQQMEHNALEVNNEVETCHGIFDDELEIPL